MDEESILIGEAQRGSRSAFTQLLRLHQGRVRAYLARYIGNRDIVDDLAQETFLSAYSELASYRGEAPFALWLTGIARHRALKHLRSEEYRRTSEGRLLAAALASWRAERAADEGAVSSHDAELCALRECVKKLPETSSLIIDEYYMKGRRVSELARHLGKKESALKMTLLRVRDALRECIDRNVSTAGTTP
jgi:RNA polymerase sigma-70 factor, ECF subfamily